MKFDQFNIFMHVFANFSIFRIKMEFLLRHEKI